MKNDKTAEIKIDKEIAKRTNNGYIHVYHITGISRKINGITIVSSSRFDYKKLLILLTDEAYRLDEDMGDVFPGDMKNVFVRIQRFGAVDIGTSICDHRDQYNYQEGRTRAKRNWLETYGYKHTVVKH